jgi:hypothetical protein
MAECRVNWVGIGVKVSRLCGEDLNGPRWARQNPSDVAFLFVDLAAPAGAGLPWGL